MCSNGIKMSWFWANTNLLMGYSSVARNFHYDSCALVAFPRPILNYVKKMGKCGKQHDQQLFFRYYFGNKSYFYGYRDSSCFFLTFFNISIFIEIE